MSSQGKRYNPEDCKIVIDGNSIERVTNTKFLGVIIDDKFTWKLHIDYLCNKLAKGIGVIRRARQSLYGESLLTLYNSLIKPHFTYCIIIWGNSYKTYLQKIFLLQKRAIRIITNSEFHAHTAPLFEKRNIMTIFELYKYFVGLFIFKSLNNHIPLCTIFYRNINARNSDNLRSVFRKLKICQFSILCSGPKTWNQFPTNVKLANSLYTFKKRLKKFLNVSISDF